MEIIIFATSSGRINSPYLVIVFTSLLSLFLRRTLTIIIFNRSNKRLGYFRFPNLIGHSVGNSTNGNSIRYDPCLNLPASSTTIHRLSHNKRTLHFYFFLNGYFTLISALSVTSTVVLLEDDRNAGNEENELVVV